MFKKTVGPYEVRLRLVMLCIPWAAPSIYPDIAGVLENPQAAYAKLSKLGGGLVKLPSADALAGTLGNTGGIGALVKG